MTTAASETETRKLTSEQQRLVERHLRLVHWVVRRHATSNAVQDLGYEDAVSCGMIGLVKAAIRFDPTRGLEFTTYAVYWIRAALQEHAPTSRLIRNPNDAYRRINGKMRDRITAHPQGCNEVDLTEQIEVPSHEQGVDVRLDADTYLDCLSQYHRDLVRMAYISGLTRRQIAAKHNCSVQHIDMTVRKTIRHIRCRYHIATGDSNG
jgi:RNA polymerase sigma factor (sigma-70 family)